MCPWPTVALTACTRCLHTWTRLLRSPRPGTFLLPLKSFAPSPSYPESCMLRAGSPAIVWGTWRHYLQRGLCTLQKQSEPEALLGGAAWGFGCLQVAGGCGREQFVTAQQPFPHSWKDTKVSAASYAAGRCKNWFTPGFQPQNLPPVSGCPAHSPPGAHCHRVPSIHLGSTPTEADGQPVWAPGAVAWRFLLGVLEIMTAQACTKSGDFSVKCLRNIFESIRCPGWGFSYFGFQDTQCWPCGGHTVRLIKLEILNAN